VELYTFSPFMFYGAEKTMLRFTNVKIVNESSVKITLLHFIYFLLFHTLVISVSYIFKDSTVFWSHCTPKCVIKS
jgi:predicted thioredoxin/glutaredoxin